MISIIVSSYNEDFFLKFSKSLNATIGVPYELIRIENKNQYCLSKAYNLGGDKAIYDFLCFVHEDVIFLTQDWGKRLLELFNNFDNLGIVGLAGSKKKSFLPTGWGTGIEDFDRISLVQVDNDIESIHNTRSGISNFENIKVLDGVFLFTKKSVWNEFKFDETLEGFHLYDIDFSLSITQKYQGIIFYDLLIAHFSRGGYNSNWIEMNLDYHERLDKKKLFEKEKSNISGIRRSWYMFLTEKNIDLKLRKRYIKTMGFDAFSIFHLLAFRFPSFGTQILFIYKVISLPIRLLLFEKK